MIPTPEQAYEILCKYNKEDFHLQHGRIVGDVLYWFANELGYADEAEYWKVVGILHDLDFEMWPDEHCSKSQELMAEEGIDESIIRSHASHCWGHRPNLPEPTHMMEKVLYATDELTGLVGAVAIMRPSGSVDDLKLKSVKKKFKTPKFAAGCSREIIQKGADLLEWDLDHLISQTILAMRASENVA